MVEKMIPSILHNKSLMYDIGSKKISLDHHHFLKLTNKGNLIPKLNTKIL
jgi:hypothetical protein